jgi:hypothetical protein
MVVFILVHGVEPDNLFLAGEPRQQTRPQDTDHGLGIQIWTNGWTNAPSTHHKSQRLKYVSERQLFGEVFGLQKKQIFNGKDS